MRNKQTLLAVLLSCYLLCWNNGWTQQVQKIYINPKNQLTQKQSNFVDSIKFIPFEFTTGADFAGYNYVRLTEKYFLITDYNSGVLYFYSKTGSFVKKLSYKSIVDNVSPTYKANTNQIVFFGNNKNYTLTSKDRVKIRLDWSNKRNLKYFKKYVIDLNDTSLTIKKAKPDQYDLIEASHFYADRYIQTNITTSPLYPDSLGHELKIYENDKLLKTYFPYNRFNEPRFLFTEEAISTFLSDTPYVSYLARPFCDTIYKLVKDSVCPVYQLVMPLENSMPANFFNRSITAKSQRENLIRNNGWVFQQVYNFYETPRLIYLNIGFFLHNEFIVYDKQTGIAYNGGKIKTDPKQYNLPLLSSFATQRSGNKFYQLIKADNLISFFKQNPDIAVPQELSVFLKANPDKNTPVVVEFKLKD